MTTGWAAVNGPIEGFRPRVAAWREVVKKIPNLPLTDNFQTREALARLLAYSPHGIRTDSMGNPSPIVTTTASSLREVLKNTARRLALASNNALVDKTATNKYSPELPQLLALLEDFQTIISASPDFLTDDAKQQVNDALISAGARIAAVAAATAREANTSAEATASALGNTGHASPSANTPPGKTSARPTPSLTPSHPLVAAYNAYKNAPNPAARQQARNQLLHLAQSAMTATRETALSFFTINPGEPFRATTERSVVAMPETPIDFDVSPDGQAILVATRNEVLFKKRMPMEDGSIAWMTNWRQEFPHRVLKAVFSPDSREIFVAVRSIDANIQRDFIYRFSKNETQHSISGKLPPPFEAQLPIIDMQYTSGPKEGGALFLRGANAVRIAHLGSAFLRGDDIWFSLVNDHALISGDGRTLLLASRKNVVYGRWEKDVYNARGGTADVLGSNSITLARDGSYFALSKKDGDKHVVTLYDNNSWRKVPSPVFSEPSIDPVVSIAISADLTTVAYATSRGAVHMLTLGPADAQTGKRPLLRRTVNIIENMAGSKLILSPDGKSFFIMANNAVREHAPREFIIEENGTVAVALDNGMRVPLKSLPEYALVPAHD